MDVIAQRIISQDKKGTGAAQSTAKRLNSILAELSKAAREHGCDDEIVAAFAKGAETVEALYERRQFPKDSVWHKVHSLLMDHYVWLLSQH